MKRIYFFGAGAEICYGLSSGKSFAEAVIGKDKNSEENKAIAKYYVRSKNHSWYPNYSKYNWSEKALNKAKIKREQCYRVLKGINFNSMDYKSLDNNEQNYNAYLGIIDSHFYTIINPKVYGPVKFWNVISSYNRAYLNIVSSILYGDKQKELTQENYFNILNCPVETIEQINKKIEEKIDIESYYKILKDNVDIDEIQIITTNYTSICEKVLFNDNSGKKIAYLNGKIGWYEAPYELKVYDVKELKYCKDIYFPYLFIQSGIKPMIEMRQYKEYSKMLGMIEDNDVKELVIVGYQFNNDDNHINSVVREFILSNKKLVYFNYSNDNIESLLVKLRLDDNYKDNIIIEDINSENCFEKFRNYIIKLNKE